MPDLSHHDSTQKEVEIGMDWEAKAEVIIRKSFQREKLMRRDSDDQ